jgi:two-component system, sensor histidine kinase PhcS
VSAHALQLSLPAGITAKHAADDAADVPERCARAVATEDAVMLEGQLAERFENEDRAITLKNVRILCVLAMILVPAAFVLDYFSYPGLVEKFFTWRVCCSLILAVVLWSTHTALGQQYFRAYTILVPMIPAAFISLMIRESGDPASPYYAGLTLCVVAIGLIFHWTFRESAIALVLTITFFLAANVPAMWRGVTPHSMGGFVTNLFFILLNGVVILLGSFYHHRIRVREFLNRTKVEQQREELGERNTELERALEQLHETEAQLIQTDKLASLGRMSAGIIHEINNPLSFSKQALFVLKKKCRGMAEDQKQSIERIIADVTEGVDRVASIVSDLRNFSHPDRGALESVALTDAINAALRFMSAEMRDRDVTIEVNVPDALLVTGDRNHLIQVLINLMQNAFDAVQKSSNPCVRFQAFHKDGKVRLTIRDNGHGISAENLSRIFDPFFTTKEVGKGMGMGLSIAFRMMQQMGGGIEARSEPGSHTEFHLFFNPATT